MTPEAAARMNELARMSPEERADALAREIFGDGFQALFPVMPTPKPYGGGIMSRIMLTVAEIQDLAEFAGLVVSRDEGVEADTPIDVYPCPPEGVRYEGEPSDPASVGHYRFVAVMSEYPEEGCIGLGEELAEPIGEES